MPPRVLPFDPIEVFLDEWEATGRAHGLEMAALASITRAQRLLLARNETVLRRFGLTFARYEALGVLASRGEAPVSMTQMSDWLMLHPTSVTNTVDRLEKQELIRRRTHPTDRRAVILELTPKGRELTEAVMAALAEEQFGIAGITDTEMEQLVALLRRVREAGGEFTDHQGVSLRGAVDEASDVERAPRSRHGFVRQADVSVTRTSKSPLAD